MIITMPENNLDKLNPAELWVFIVVIISGAVGACSGAFMTKTRSKKLLNILSFCGYMVSGSFASVLMFILSSPLGYFNSWEDIIFFSMITGFITSISLLANNLVFKFVIKKLGLEIDVEIKRNPPKKK